MIGSFINMIIVYAGGNTATVPEAFKKDKQRTLIKWEVLMKN